MFAVFLSGVFVRAFAVFFLFVLSCLGVFVVGVCFFTGVGFFVSGVWGVTRPGNGNQEIHLRRFRAAKTFRRHLLSFSDSPKKNDGPTFGWRRKNEASKILLDFAILKHSPVLGRQKT